MDQGAKLWLYKTAKQQFWRVSGWYEFDDLVQDGIMCYWRVVRKYPRIPKRSSAHRMALFKRTFLNHIHDLAKQRTRLVPEVYFEDAMASHHEPQEFLALSYAPPQEFLACAPPLVQMALIALTAPNNGRSLRAKYRLRKDGTRETFNDRLCQMLGLDPRLFDVPAAVRSYLASTEIHAV